MPSSSTLRSFGSHNASHTKDTALIKKSETTPPKNEMQAKNFQNKDIKSSEWKKKKLFA